MKMSDNKATTGAASTNWALRGKAATKAIPLTTKSRDYGVKHLGAVETFTPKSYKTGSFGVEISYTVEGLERKVYENIVLKVMGADGILKDTQYGKSTLIKRLQAFGLDSEAVNAFPIPVSPKSESTEYDLAGAPVTIYIKQEEYMGKPQNRVGSVFPQD